jgi:MSHA pilin protein MshD
MRGGPPRARTGGFLLVEASLASAILGLALVTLVPTFLLSIKASKAAEQTKVSAQLSSELIEEIRLRRWDELTPLPVKAIATGSAALGVETGESAADKRTFDDIDDFNGWTENPLVDPMMQAVSGFTGYSRSVTVRYVTAGMATSATATDYKLVHVCTQSPRRAAVCIDTLFTNH